MKRTIKRRRFIKAVLGTAGASASAAFLPHAVSGESGTIVNSNNIDTSENIAMFASSLTYEQLSPAVIDNIKLRLLDALGCGIGAIGAPETDIVKKSVNFSDSDSCTVLGCDKKTSAAEAALVNTSMTRYLDYMDSYVGPYGGGHPSDCIASTIACIELTGGTTKDLIAAIAASYEIVGAFADHVQTRDRGWDHLGFVGVAMAAGAGRALRLNQVQLQNALSIMAASYNPLRVTRSEQLTMWKGFAAGLAAFNAVQSSILAMNGMIGPRNTFSGSNGWNDVIAGEDVSLQFTSGERALKVWTKLYLAETYALSAVEGAIELATEHDIPPEKVKAIHVETFHDAILNIGAAEGRDAYRVSSKSEADHSFPYMIAAAVLDRKLSNQQYVQERIRRDDVQNLLRKVSFEENPSFNAAFAKGKSPASLVITMEDGASYKTTKEYFTGHPNEPATRSHVADKLHYLNNDYLDGSAIEKLTSIVDNIEAQSIHDLTSMLSN